MGTMPALSGPLYLRSTSHTVLCGRRPDYELIDLKTEVKPKWKKTCTPYTTHTLRTTRNYAVFANDLVSLLRSKDTGSGAKLPQIRYLRSLR